MGVLGTAVCITVLPYTALYIHSTLSNSSYLDLSAQLLILERKQPNPLPSDAQKPKIHNTPTYMMEIREQAPATKLENVKLSIVFY